ncbi:MAG TPA: twin-arginine translocation signal domain-containing protein, partial [Terriglobia bacterium]|nr:twin-arginine translocation signal domain-containing protein [Terriglobia bacterium]
MSTKKKVVDPGSQPNRREFLKRSAVGSVGALLSSQIALSRSVLGRAELQNAWKISSAREVSTRDEDVSKSSFDTSNWHPVRKMPATVLQALEDAGVYKDLYFGKNLTETVPRDLWKQDWWYRTVFDAPQAEVYSLIFEGINYRA